MREDAVPVEMNFIEIYWGLILGGFRRTSGWKNGLNANKHATKSDWATDVNGAIAEMTLAKWLRVYYEPRNMDFKGPDVGRRCQARSTTYRDGHLIVRKNDEEIKKQPFVLVITPSTPDITPDEKRPRVKLWLAGWLYGDQCMKKEWWNDDRWQVPQSALEPMSTFPFPRQEHLFYA